jgi:Ca2+-dependent lipid-binding protein
MACDKNGLSDPYCIIYLQNKEGKESQNFKTTTQYKTLSPSKNYY